MTATEEEQGIKKSLSSSEQNNESIDRLHKRYYDLRLYSGSVYSLWALGACLIGLGFKQESLNMHITRLGKLANYAVCDSNDIYSEQKERLKNKDGHFHAINTIFILEKQGMTRKEAIKKIENKHNADMQEFIRELEAYKKGYTNTKDGLIYVEMMKCWIYGNHLWSAGSEDLKASERYPGVKFLSLSRENDATKQP